jgi:hypothetical protein
VNFPNVKIFIISLHLASGALMKQISLKSQLFSSPLTIRRLAAAERRGTRGRRFRDGDKLTCFTFQSNKVLEHEMLFGEEGNVVMFRPKLTQSTGVSDYMRYVIANAPESLSDATST